MYLRHLNVNKCICSGKFAGPPGALYVLRKVLRTEMRFCYFVNRQHRRHRRVDIVDLVNIVPTRPSSTSSTSSAVSIVHIVHRRHRQHHRHRQHRRHRPSSASSICRCPLTSSASSTSSIVDIVNIVMSGKRGCSNVGVAADPSRQRGWRRASPDPRTWTGSGSARWRRGFPPRSTAPG